ARAGPGCVSRVAHAQRARRRAGLQRTGALGLAAFAVLGVWDGIVGPAWPTIRHDLHQPLAALGEVSAAVSIGAVVAGLATGRVRRRLAAGAFLVLGSLAATAGLAVCAATPWWPLF